jgi:general stress protein 26
MSQTDRDQLRALIQQFHSGMLVTRTPEDTLHGRPMAIAKLEDNDDIFFATSIESGKIGDVESDHQVVLTLQSSAAWVSVSGPARIIQDRAKIEAYWNEAMKVWFPKGKTDPSLCLLRLRPAQAEFWDTQGTKRLRYLYEAAKAYVTGTTPEALPGQHGEVKHL